MKTFWKIILSLVPALGVLLHLIFVTGEKINGPISLLQVLSLILLVSAFFLIIKKETLLRVAAYRSFFWATWIFLMLPFSLAGGLWASYLRVPVAQRGFGVLALVLVAPYLLAISLIPFAVSLIVMLILRPRKNK